MTFFRRQSTDPELLLKLQVQITELRGELDDLKDKHARLRGAFYAARQGLDASGEPITPRRKRSQPTEAETKEEFRARMQGLRPGRAPPPTDDEE